MMCGIAELETSNASHCLASWRLSMKLCPQRKRLLSYLATRSSSGFAQFQANSVARQVLRWVYCSLHPWVWQVQYSVGPAGTGQPSVRCPPLNIRPQAFFALGSPIGEACHAATSDSLCQGCSWRCAALRRWAPSSSSPPAPPFSTFSIHTTR